MPPIRQILVARDFSPASERALQTALILAAQADATLHFVHAEVLHSDPYGTPPDPAATVDKVRERMKERFENDRDDRARFDPASVRIEHAVVRDVAAASALVRYAKEHDIDLIVMGTHGRTGLRRFLLGSVAEEVVRWAPCPVLAIRAEAVPFDDAHSILAAVDFSAPSEAAVKEAARLAHLLGARLDLLHVIEMAPFPPFYTSRAKPTDVTPELSEEVLAQLRSLAARAAGPESDLEVGVHVSVGAAARTIVDEAERLGAHLVVVGTQGLAGLDHLLLGSVAERVLRLSKQSVLVVKSEAGTARAEKRVEAASELSTEPPVAKGST